jgi:hypothetical protein
MRVKGVKLQFTTVSGTQHSNVADMHMSKLLRESVPPVEVLLQICVHVLIAHLWGIDETPLQSIHQKLEVALRRLRPLLLHLRALDVLAARPAASPTERDSVAGALEIQTQLARTMTIYRELHLLDVVRPFAGCAVPKVPSRHLLQAALSTCADVVVVGAGERSVISAAAI